ncbi:MAG: phenylalanine--tRNA ligase subunit beta [Clostridiales bacterium]|nr:phenylalanine--tRNA ligase subunit beta [Clostridiales bacterium]
MNLSLEWANDFVDISGISPKDYCDRLTATGSKVEGYEVIGDDIENVVVGKVLKLERHPDSDHLWICQIDVGEAEPVQIVTGAQNLFVGAIVPVAKSPSKLPGGVNIKAGKLRGVPSNGMLCSIGELNLTTHDMPNAIEDGIFIMDGIDCKPGDDIHDALKLNDTVVEFEITSNRPDCLSVIGLARETAVSFDREFKLPTPAVTYANDGDKIDNYLAVEVKDSILCPRYTARVVKNVKIAPSPLWLRMRLRASGVRPINNIVDITNYVMLEYGQPMHAFDYTCLDGKKIIVRTAADGENFKSLDDTDHTLNSTNLVIADEKKAVALAGVMGGANSEITDSTVTVVFESANFLGSSVRVTAKSQGMRTESSGRFEKGLDPENTLPALDRACELVTLLGAGEVVDGTIDVYGGKQEPYKMKLEVERINSFLGLNVSADYMKNVLEKLEFKVDGDTLTVPSFRADCRCMNDIAEEILRIYGYNTIEATRFVTPITSGSRTPTQRFELLCADLLCAMGLYECETFSFISPKYYDKINLPADDVRRKSIVISNPLGEDTSVMRTTAIPSMLEVLARNNNYHAEKTALYEIATTYTPDADPTKLPEERRHIVMGFFRDGDFYTLKGMCDTLLDRAGITNAVYTAESNEPTFHPGRCAKITAADGTLLAVIGEIHPAVQENYSIDAPVYIADFDFENLFDKSKLEKTFKALPKFPATTRDFAFVCDDTLEVGAIEAVMKKAGGKALESIKLFDVYRGKQLGEGKKSVAFSVTLRAADHTLTDEEADKVVKKILTLLDRELGITLRA